ncbi:MAG TPA: S8 family serine peptidase [Thermoanaerobaculia bacterium]|nr:S8 family serine peptidase [Thermoanaerobaculia bacterium]
MEVIMRASPVWLFAVTLLLAGSNLTAATLSDGRKALLLFKQPNASAAATIVDDSTTVLEEYQTFTLLSVPKSSSDTLISRAQQAGVTLSFHDEFDTLNLPGAVVDTRLGLAGLPGERIAPYEKGKYGLYVLQFTGPVRKEWLDSIAAVGGIVVDSIPVNGYLLALTPEMAAGLSKDGLIQFLEPFHPFLKAASVDALQSDLQPVLVDFAEAPGLSDALAEVNLILRGSTRRRNRSGYYLFGYLQPKDAAQILRNPLVIGVHEVPRVIASDERQVMSLSANVTAQSGNLIPTSPGTYSSWLTGSSACDLCGNLSGEHFKIGLADSGADGSRPDLTGRVEIGSVLLTQRDLQGNCPPSPPPPDPPNVCENVGICFTCDGMYHGTFVSGVFGGSGTGTAKRDWTASTTGFFLGTGVAPTAGIVATKFLSSTGGEWLAKTIFDRTRDATLHGAYVQNHSYNQYTLSVSTSGKYTVMSRDFDVAVRDSQGLAGLGSVPVTLTASAGNQHEDTDQLNRGLVSPPATAKNVIAIGAAEGVRDSAEWRQCFNPSADADSFRNIMADSKHGTLVQSGGHGWDTYIKPDLFAPATQVVSALSTSVPSPAGCMRYGQDYLHFPDPDYAIVSGTSFSSPMGAGAALIASRVFAASLGGTPSPSAASPALLKAMLVGSAISMRGGMDKTNSTTIGALPNAVQGFGRVSLVDVVSHTPSRQYVNQDTPKFMNAGELWSGTYAVDDPAKPVKVVLSWTDPPALADSGAVATLLQNDLDLFVNVGHSTDCRRYVGNHLDVIDTNRGEESVQFQCGQIDVDTKNNTELVTVFPNVAGVNQFTIVVQATRIQASAVPDADCPQNPNSDCNDQDFALFIYNAHPRMNLAAPTGVQAAANGSASVSVSWSPVLGADRYEVSRRDSGGYAVLNANITANSFSDVSVSPNVAYLYRVRAFDPAGNPGAYSSPDLATTVPFDDEPLAANSIIRAAHVEQLRAAINCVRTTAGLGAGSFTDSPPLAGIVVKAVHLAELRASLDQAIATLSLPARIYSDPTLIAGVSIIKSAHVQELRDALK